MFIRIVDYAGNPGGGVRFIVEAVAALASLPDAPRIEFVSDGQAFATYEKAFRERCPTVGMWRVRPINNPRLWNHWYHSLPGMTLLPALLRGGDRASLLRYDVPESVTRGVDAVWMPWIHGHRLTGGHDRVVATYHDTIRVDFPGILPPGVRKQAMDIELDWCQSKALVTVTSNATAAALERLYKVKRDRFPVVRLSAIHRHPEASNDDSAVEGSWQTRPYLLCPANTTVHKNHEVLLEGYSLWGAKMPLVLTGSGTDFLRSRRSGPRARQLRALASRLHLDETRVIGLGYISDKRYWPILKSAYALVMPTLAEGGGSFPVAEAVQARIPVICSDIPVMREAIEVYGGCPIWFNPHEPQGLAVVLASLETNYRDWRKTAESCSSTSPRSWAQVAAEYLTLLAHRPNIRDREWTVPTTPLEFCDGKDS
jgi:glycosyltransferase involved in cell wall biosynthesis